MKSVLFFKQKSLVSSAVIILIVLLTLLGVHPALAQEPSQWNRRVESISILPDAGTTNQFVVRGYFSIDANEITEKKDLSTILEFRVNGIVIDQQIGRFSVEPSGTSSPCGTCDFFDICSCGTNPQTGVFGCECGSLLTFFTTTTSLQPSDEIMVILYPAPGALPEQSGQTGDDQLIVTYQGRALFWERRLVNVSIEPAVIDPDSFFDVFVDVGLSANYDGQLNLGTDVQVLVGGVEYTTVPLTIPDDITWSSCVGTCAGQDCAFILAGPTGFCTSTLVGWTDCECALGNIPQLVIPAVPAPSGDEIMVLLRPAPGALPELPGCIPSLRSDMDDDCDVDAFDYSIFALDWLECYHGIPSLCFQ
jgi:hypothetical protein